MLKADTIPTPLVSTDRRPPITIVGLPKPAPFPALSVAVRLAWWGTTMVWLRVTRGGSPSEYGRRFRVLLEELGGLWIKLGQLLSLRADLFSFEFCRELSRLQVKAVGFPPEEAMRILEADLGGSIQSFFSEFDEAPYAAASMGQVHLARLRDSGVRVAIKVQRPNLPWTFTHQLRVIRWLVGAIQLLHFRSHMRWPELIWELDQIMLEEMDCRYEAGSTRRIRRTLEPHDIYVPKVFHATRRVLVTEFIDGVLMADYIETLGANPERLKSWLAENRIDPQAVGRLLSISFLRQIIEDNLYHGDLHPGNIMLLRDSRVALIDFGACNFTEREYLDRFRMSLQALACRDYAKATDLSLHLCGTMPRVDLDVIREKFLNALCVWAVRTGVRELPYHEKSVALIYTQLLRILYDHHCTMEWALLRIRRAQETLDASLMHLFPDADHLKLAAEYFRAADRRSLTSSVVMEPRNAALSSLRAAFEIEEQVNEYTVFQASIIRRSALPFLEATGNVMAAVSIIVSQLSGLAVIGAITITATFIAQRRPEWLGFLEPASIARLSRFLPPLDWQIWSVILAGVAYICFLLLRLRIRLRQRDPQPAERVARI